MDSWLARVTKLAAIRTSEPLVDEYAVQLREELGVESVHVLVPSPDGRTLVARYGFQELVWAVDDFEHPFSHILQSPSSMLLDEDKRMYWLGNAAFCSLTEKVRKEQGVLLQPLPPDEPHVSFITVIIGDMDELCALMNEIDWLEFSKIFVFQWQVVSAIEYQINQQSVLTESIARIRQKERDREMSLALRTKLIGSSSAMQQVRKQVVTAAQSDLTVCIQGETGTGKELAAQAVHALSSRSSKPFIAINCAAIPENLLESELFGYERGAFSGAEHSKRGLLAEANGGTLFLDEIGDMPLQLQAKLLRVLETRKFRPVGGKKEVSSDFRLVAATHVRLREHVENRAFRSDLYYRLNQFPLPLPPLKKRKGDITELALHFVELYNVERGAGVTGIRQRVLERLNAYDFPGNVRELRNVIDFACAQTASGKEITLVNIEKSSCKRKSSKVKNKIAESEEVFSDISNLRQALMNYETEIIKSRLAQYGGNRAKTAVSLNVPKRTLAHKCQKLEIESW
jgi:sigma-54-specific transcriptional regulator